jgi:nitrate/TMAO reductase-like tetraheme cytochrome c subunit
MNELMKIASKRAYLSPEFCGKCHQSQYEQWLNTGHAHAIETLIERKRMDKGCLTCHSLEFRMRGVVTETKKRGVECVDCHVELQDPATAKMHGQRPGERPTTRIVDERVCTRCHDKQNSPNFNPQTYMPKVIH